MVIRNWLNRAAGELGLALGGAEGLARIFDLLSSELRRTMLLTGVHDVEQIALEVVIQVE
jgi:isopentenyl diphosphate isomerase/L-lactate dehydrogenase-like FMN-dependent dehydrogenase